MSCWTVVLVCILHDPLSQYLMTSSPPSLLPEGRQFVEDTLFRWNDAFSRAIEENPDLPAKVRRV